MNNYYKIFKKYFYKNLVKGLISFTVIVVLSMILILEAIDIWVRKIGYDFLYNFYFIKVERYSLVITLVLIIIGYSIIFTGLLLKSCRYLDEIIGAVDLIHEKDSKLISLSSDLKDVADKMNRIKISLKDKEKKALDEVKRKNDLIIYLAHDLKTPLTSIIGYLDILKEERDLNQQFKEKYLKISYDKALRLEDLINEFFDITRYNLQDLVVDKVYVNFSLMMEQIIYEFKPLLVEKNLKLDADIGEGISLKIDPNKMERVIDNIIRNAINYSYKDNPILVRVFIEGSFLNLNLINRGANIPDKKINYIFDEFFRVDSSRNTETGGAGLGLAIAKSIVLAHDGEISMESEDETITTRVILPI